MQPFPQDGPEAPIYRERGDQRREVVMDSRLAIALIVLWAIAIAWVWSVGPLDAQGRPGLDRPIGGNPL